MRLEEVPSTQNMWRVTPCGDRKFNFFFWPSYNLVISCIQTQVVNGVYVKISANLLWNFVQNNKLNFLLIFVKLNFKQLKIVYLFLNNYQNSRSAAILGYSTRVYGKRILLSGNTIKFQNFPITWQIRGCEVSPLYSKCEESPTLMLHVAEQLG